VWYLPVMVADRIFHNVKALFVALSLIIGVTVLPGGVSASETAPTLVTVRIDGLRKTQESVVLDLINLERNDLLDAVTVQEVEDTLVKSDLFAAVTVYVVPAGWEPDEIPLDRVLETAPVPPATGPADLRVLVDEKWTLVPIPFFSSGGDGFSGGLILLESNLFGRNKQLITAAFGGTGGFSGFFLYADPSVFSSNWTASLSAAAGRSEEETLRPDGETVRAFTVNQQSAGLGIGYRLTPELNVRTRLGVSTWRVDEFTPGLDDEEIEDGSYLEPQIGVNYEKTRPIDVLLVGPSVSAAARYVTLDDGWEVSARAGWALPVFETHRVRILGSGGYGEMPAIAETGVSARDGFRTLPYQATTADRWASGSLFYDLPVMSAGWGALVLSHYWEAGAYETETLSPQPFYGPGGGFRVYIRQVAIPAVGLDVAYNLADPAWVFSFTVGAQM
jgi:hypothetical protein